MSRILMVTPILKSQRGNSITASRLHDGLSRMGFEIDILPLEETGWQAKLDRLTAGNRYVLVHGLHALQFSAVADHPALKGLPVLVTTTGTDINYDLSGTGRKKVLEILERAAGIVAFNAELAGRIEAAGPGLASKISIIPQGVDLPDAPAVTRVELGLPEENTVFILPSGLRPVKNIDMAIDGLCIAREVNPRISLVLAGAVIDGDYADAISLRIKDLHWTKYLGEVPHGSIAGIMRISDVVLNTSLAEGQPQAVLEAMSLGMPCILSQVPGNIGVIQDGVHGFYVNSAREMAKAALRLINDPLLRYKMGLAARQMVNKRYSSEKEINAYAGLYKTLIS